MVALNGDIRRLDSEKLALKRENNRLKEEIRELKQDKMGQPDISAMTNLYSVKNEEE